MSMSRKEHLSLMLNLMGDIARPCTPNPPKPSIEGGDWTLRNAVLAFSNIYMILEEYNNEPHER